MVQIVKFKVTIIFLLIHLIIYSQISSLAVQNRCNAGVCLAGTCYEQTIGASTYAYCQCTPGYRGVNCNQCLYLFIINL